MTITMYVGPTSISKNQLGQLMISQGTTIQLLCFLAAEFPVQLLIKRYGFKQILPFMMMSWGLVCPSKSYHSLCGIAC